MQIETTTEETTMTQTYYAVCNASGPISVRLDAATADEARAAVADADTRAWIDSARTDAEDDLGIAGEGMDEATFAAALEFVGAQPAVDLAPAHNAHAGTTAHLAGGWVLWVIDEGA